MNINNLAVVFCPTLRISKPMFVALLSRGELLWKDLHPDTPKPQFDQTFNSMSPLVDEQPNANDYYETGKVDDYYGTGKVDDYYGTGKVDGFNQQSQPIGFGISIPTTDGSYRGLSTTSSGSMGLNEHPHSFSSRYQNYSVTGRAFSDRISTGKSLSSSRSTDKSLNSGESETELSESDLNLEPPPLMHDSGPRPKLSIDVLKSNQLKPSSYSNRSTRSNQQNKGRSPRALFLKPSASHSNLSRSAPGTPANLHH